MFIYVSVFQITIVISAGHKKKRPPLSSSSSRFSPEVALVRREAYALLPLRWSRMLAGTRPRHPSPVARIAVPPGHPSTSPHLSSLAGTAAMRFCAASGWPLSSLYFIMQLTTRIYIWFHVRHRAHDALWSLACLAVSDCLFPGKVV